VNKIAASAAQLAKCILLYAYSRATASFQLHENKLKLYSLFNKLAYQIFGYTLRTIETENPKKLRTANLNSKFTGSYKKKVYNAHFA